MPQPADIAHLLRRAGFGGTAAQIGARLDSCFALEWPWGSQARAVIFDGGHALERVRKEFAR